MQLAISHPWDLPVSEAKALQEHLAHRVVAQAGFWPEAVHSVAGVDVSFLGGIACAAVVVLAFPGLQPVASSTAQMPVAFPYVPGLLAFREGPAVLEALRALGTWPDLFIFDAQGVAHPRRLGLAAHLGVVLDWPSIGCAKSRLLGHFDEPGPCAGDWAPLHDAGQVVGAAVRTARGRKPVFVSVGHRIDLAGAMEWVLRCTRGHRLPETTRCAHRLAGLARREMARAGTDPGAR
jgi:deoxyribonuclease V